MEELAAGLIDALVGVGAEVIALRLEQVGRQAFAAVAVVEGQGGGERGNGNAGFDGLRYDAAPGFLAALDDAGEVRIEQQVAQGRVAGRRLP